MDQQDYERIRDKTNKIMKPFFDIDHKPGSDKDNIIKEPEREATWTSCEPYLSHLPEVWGEFKKENPDMASYNPYISTLDKCGIIDRLYKRRNQYAFQNSMKRERIIEDNWDLAEDIIKNEKYTIKRTSVSLEIQLKSPKKYEEKNGQTSIEYLTEGEEKNIIFKLSEQILRILHIKSIDDYE